MRKPRQSRVGDPDRALRQDNQRQGPAHGLLGRFRVYVAPTITRPLPHLLFLNSPVGVVHAPYNPFEVTS